jgi:ComF family protein
VLDALADIVFPPVCVACDAVLPGPGFFCEACRPMVEQTPSPRCARCGEPGRFDKGACPRCAARAPEFHTAFAPFEHAGALARAIHRFKYEDHPELARPLAHLMAQAAPEALEALPGTLVPVPLHEARFRERKFDQATLLAVELAKVLKRPLEDAWLTRARATERQVGLSDSAREANVRGAFTAAPHAKGQQVVLVDDVFTTGATARAAAKALLDAGAAQVSVLTVARAFREES